VARAHTARVGGRTNWLGKKIVTARTRSYSPPSDFRVGHFPKCRFICPDPVGSRFFRCW
jgi:hypothetical protein